MVPHIFPLAQRYSWRGTDFYFFLILFEPPLTSRWEQSKYKDKAGKLGWLWQIASWWPSTRCPLHMQCPVNCSRQAGRPVRCLFFIPWKCWVEERLVAFCLLRKTSTFPNQIWWWQFSAKISSLENLLHAWNMVTGTSSCIERGLREIFLGLVHLGLPSLGASPGPIPGASVLEEFLF